MFCRERRRRSIAQRVFDRARRRRIFLHALASGKPVALACAQSRLAWSTLYRWRQQDAAFREAWDTALCAGADAMAARFDSELMRRAIEGVDEPVFHKGAIVGVRKRYSDPLLMFGISDLRLRRAPSPPVGPPPVAPPNENSRITVVVRQFGAPAADSAAPAAPRDAG